MESPTVVRVEMVDAIGTTVPWQAAGTVLTGSHRVLAASPVVDEVAVAARQQPLRLGHLPGFQLP